MQATEMAEICHFLSLVTLTFDLAFQTRQSKGPSMSSVWIWHKSVQHFTRYFIHKQKTTDWRQARKNRRTFRSSLCVVIT